MAKTDLEYAKEEAIRQYAKRVESAAQIEHIENQKLPAGSDMYYYCGACGVATEVLPENYLFTPYKLCSQCQGLKEQGWLEDAQRSIRS